MKRKTKAIIKNKLLNITADLLEQLYFMGGDTFSAALSKKSAFKIFNNNYYHKYTETPFTKWLDRLRSEGYVSYEHGSDSFEFTTKTKLKLAREIGENCSEHDIYSFFSFDIPETKRTQRNKFRIAIKKLGCKQIQKSLWVTNKNIFDYVQLFALELGIERYIISIISSKTDIDGLLDKMFYSE